VRVDVSPRTARRWVQMARHWPGRQRGGQRVWRRAPHSEAGVSRLGGRAPRPAAGRHRLRAGGDAAPARRRARRSRHGARCHHLYRSPGGGQRVSPGPRGGPAAVEAEKQARQSVTDALIWMLEHVIAAWLKQGAAFKDYADFNRDHYRCTAPGCTARRSLQSHHLVFQSAGGPTRRGIADALRIPSPAGHSLPHHALQRTRVGRAGLRAGPAGHRAAAAAGPCRGRAALGLRPVAVVVVVRMWLRRVE